MKGSLIGNSPWLQLLIVFLLSFAGSIFFVFVGLLFSPLLFDIHLMDLTESLDDLPSLLSNTDLLKFLQGLSSIGTFLIPGIMASILLSRYPASFLSINSFPKKGGLVIILVVLLTLSGTVISDALYRLSYQIPFPDFLMEIKAYLDNTQETMGQQMEVLLRMDSFFDFFYIFFLLAVLPAICEETLFRGVVQPLFIKGFKNVHLGILVTSLIFGVMHQQFYSFMSITALSIVLGYLKEWSKSLWIPIIMHLINNGTIVISIYYFNVSLEEANDLSGGWDQGYFVVGIVLFASVLYLLRRIIQKNGTHFYS